jgi:hypothetical protein
LKIHGSIFVKPGQEGDFAWMIKQPQYEKALFVFNDNIEEFMKYLVGTGGFAKGKGNAVIRPYRKSQPPHAAGIPTGSLRAGVGGFRSLDESKYLIDRALEIIYGLVATGHYDQIIYSDDGQGGLGTGIFRVNREVKDYIVKGLHDLV